MKKLAIVSSYSDSCGNASFTKILKSTIEDYSDVKVEVLELNLKLLQSADRIIRPKADKHIHDLAQLLKSFDAVNIQLEPGLYGKLPQDIIKRTQILFKANPNTSVTLHSVRVLNWNSTRVAIKLLLQLKLRSFLQSLKTDVHVFMHRGIIKNIIKNKCRLIVHTKRAADLVEQLFSYKRIDVHPLKIVGESHVFNPAFITKLRRDLSIKETDKIIGLFGYISAYKGHVEALEALKLLPQEYKLLIFGRVHPQTIDLSGNIDEHLSNLLSIISNKESTLDKRVFFLGELDDQNFFDACAFVDAVWLPYRENGQDGSGIASICLDACPKVLCSASFAFDELFKLVHYNNVVRFDIGNYMELAQKTQLFLKETTTTKAPFCDLDKFNQKTQAALYLKELNLAQEN